MAFVGFGSIHFINEGEVGVKTRFGNVVGDEVQPGLAITIPVIESMHKLDVRSQTYTMSGGEGGNTVQALTSEGLNLETLDISVRYHLNSSYGKQVYSQIGTGDQLEQKLIRPTIRSGVRQCTAQFTSQEIYSEARDNLADCIHNKTAEDFEQYGFIVEKVQIRNIMLPERVRNAIQKKIEAEQEIQQKENQIQVAKKEAERKRVEARGIADSNRIIGSSLSEEYLKWYWIKNLDSHQSVMYVPSGQGGMPIMKDVDKMPGNSNFTGLANSNVSMAMPNATQ